MVFLSPPKAWKQENRPRVSSPCLLISARKELPFPIYLEVLFMELFFELLREAGVRLPRTIGQSVSIVGGLVIGQATVNAGFVGYLPVIVVALTVVHVNDYLCDFDYRTICSRFYGKRGQTVRLVSGFHTTFYV